MRLVYQKNSLSSQTKSIPHSHGGKKNIYPANQEKGFTQNLIQQKINYLVESLGWQQTACAGWGPAFNESRILQNFTAFQRNIPLPQVLLHCQICDVQRLLGGTGFGDDVKTLSRLSPSVLQPASPALVQQPPEFPSAMSWMWRQRR